MKLLVATTNAGKLREFESMLGALLPSQTELVGLSEFGDLPPVVEDGETFEANALKKARQMSHATGLTTLADDSGLVVDALGGRPGVHSARYAGDGGPDANNARLVDELRGVDSQQRTARFVCVIALCVADDPLGKWFTDRLGAERIITVRGVCEGRIVDEPRGDGGFGYDPLFWVDEFGATLAEVPLAEKNRVSHRAMALRELADRLSAS